ncbi:26959_t:CDS:1, partial [Gigaspora margarita]
QIHSSTIRFHLSTIKFHPYTVRFHPFKLHSTVSQVPLEGFQVLPEGFHQASPFTVKLYHPIKLCLSTVKLRPSTSEFHPRAPLNSFASSPTASQVSPEGFKLYSQGCKLYLMSLQVLPTGFYDLPD